MHYFGDGILAWVNHWEPYALALAAIGGVIVAQSALQTGALGAAVGATEAMGPVSAAILGLALLDERVAAANAPQIAAIVLSVGAILTGMVMLSHAEERLMRDVPSVAASGYES
jgi:hypothetical protein